MIEMKTLTMGGKTRKVVDGNAVHFDAPQDLTPEEQAQARDNVGAVSAAEVIAIVDEKLSSITNAEEVAY